MGSPSNPERSAETAGKSGFGRTIEEHLERIDHALTSRLTTLCEEARRESLTAIRERIRELERAAVPSPASQREDRDGPKA